LRRLVGLLLAAAAAGQDAEPAPAPEPAEPAAPVRHEVRLRSGTRLVGKLDPARWSVKTAFGLLSIPATDIRGVRFGRRSAPERAARVDAWIDHLTAASPDVRRRARAGLMANGPFAAGALKRGAKDHAEPDVRKLCGEILEELALDEEQLVPEQDRVETNAFDLVGRIEVESIKVTVAELGGITVRRRDVVEIRRAGSVRVRKVSVDGSHLWPNNWLDTKIKFEKGAPLELTAEGTITFPNWGNRTFTPNGDPRFGNINGMPMGALAARVGKGQIFLAGTNYSGKAPASGTLQLCLVFNAQGQPHHGSFTVKVKDR